MKSSALVLVFVLLLSACNGSPSPVAPTSSIPAATGAPLPSTAPKPTGEAPVVAITTTTASPQLAQSDSTFELPTIDEETLSLAEVDQLLADLDSLLADLDESFKQQEGVDIDG